VLNRFVTAVFVIGSAALLYQYLSTVETSRTKSHASLERTTLETRVPATDEVPEENIAAFSPVDDPGNLPQVVREPDADSSGDIRDNPVIADENRLVTVDNITGLFFQDGDETMQLIYDAAREQGSDPNWSGRAASDVEAILASSGIDEFSKERIVECYVTVCIVEFLDSALFGFEPKLTTEEFAAGEFERVLWYRLYQKDAAYLFLLLPEFEHRR